MVSSPLFSKKMNSDPVEITFRPITIADKSLIQQYLRSGRTTCDWAFATLFCWQHAFGYQWAEVKGWLVIRCRINGERRVGFMVMPRDASQPYVEIVPILSREAERQRQPLLLVSLEENERRRLLQECPDCFVLDSNRDFQDYVYDREELATLRGRKFAPKRNHVNKFTRLYQYTYEPLQRKDFAECLRLENVWRDQHNSQTDGLTAEQQAIRLALDNYEALNLTGGVLRVEGDIVAFTYGSPLGPSLFCTHIEKADVSYDGAYPMINYLFARHLPEQYTHINREEDMGLPGLRKSKLSYMPVCLSPKYVALQMNDDMRDVKKVWKECFGDEDTFVNSFLARYYFPDCSYVHKEDGHVVSMAFMVPCMSELGPTAYLYAIATLPQYRSKGFAGRLVQDALSAAKQRGFTAAMLIPEGSDLKVFYTCLGFQDVDIPVTITGDLDLGTGDESADRAMLAPLAEGLQLPESLSGLKIELKSSL